MVMHYLMDFIFTALMWASIAAFCGAVGYSFGCFLFNLTGEKDD